jgi:23S rRNA (cytosine1962-C5)-methyltransferase
VAITESNVSFNVNLLEGQKTGFYLDQRDNRQSVARYATGRKVLDAFCYTGGFGLLCAKAGAQQITGVDISTTAITLAKENAAQNKVQNISFIQGEVFPFLEQAVQQGERFGLIVLDPPKFARQRRAVEDALRGYRRLQTLSLLLLEPNGLLVTCCCSGLIQMSMLEELLAQVAAENNRFVQILERRGQPPDHPISASCLETAYLKCLIARVT